MPVIVFASSKGGAGKTTAAFTLATVAAHHGASVALIDADPNQPLVKWAAEHSDNLPPGLQVISAIGDDVMDAIDSSKAALTIVDLEGSKNQDVSVGIGRADLVLIPMTGSRLDANEATSVIRVIKRQETAFRRKIPFRILLTRLSAVVIDRQTKDIIGQFKESNIPMLNTFLVERAAYKSMFHIGKNLYQMSEKEVSKPEVAVENAEKLVAEVRKVLAEILNPASEVAHV
jgi:chromosome partitioning protein